MKVFISYRSIDRALVSKLAEDFEQLGHEVWFDRELTTQGGQRWWDNILTQLEACDLFVFALSDAALDSLPCQREYRYAYALGKRILPVIIKKSKRLNDLPVELRQVQFVAYEGRTRQQTMNLAGSLARLPAAQPPPVPLPLRPPVPISDEARLYDEVLRRLDQTNLTADEQKSLSYDIAALAENRAYRSKAADLYQRLINHPTVLKNVADEARKQQRALTPASRMPLVFAGGAVVAVILIGLLIAAAPSIFGSSMGQTLTKEVAVVPTSAPTFTPTNTSVPPSATSLPPSATNIPATNTSAPASATATLRPLFPPTSTLAASVLPSPTPIFLPSPTSLPPLFPSLSPTSKVSQGACTPSNNLKVATDGSYPPFETFAPQQQGAQFSGFDIDLLTVIAKNQGLNVSFTDEDFSTIFAKLAQGEYTAVINGVTITEERAKVVDFSSPYFTTGTSVFIRKTDANKYKTLASLTGQKIGVQTGTLNTLITEKIKGAVIKEYNLVGDTLRALSNKEIEAVMLDSATGLNLITEQKLALMIAVRNITSESFGIAVRKDCTEVLAKINAGLQAIINDGTYNTIYKKYFGEDAPSAFLPQK